MRGRNSTQDGPLRKRQQAVTVYSKDHPISADERLRLGQNNGDEEL